MYLAHTIALGAVGVALVVIDCIFTTDQHHALQLIARRPRQLLRTGVQHLQIAVCIVAEGRCAKRRALGPTQAAITEGGDGHGERVTLAAGCTVMNQAGQVFTLIVGVGLCVIAQAVAVAQRDQVRQLRLRASTGAFVTGRADQLVAGVVGKRTYRLDALAREKLAGLCRVRYADDIADRVIIVSQALMAHRAFD